MIDFQGLRTLMNKAVGDYSLQYKARVTVGLDPVILLEKLSDDCTVSLAAQRILLRAAAHIIVARNLEEGNI